MKKLLLLILFLTATSYCYPQGWPWTGYLINFESPDSILTLDTPLVNNIWQIGQPSKIIFSSASSAPNAIMTDTLNYYPTNNLSSFKIKIYDPAWGPSWNFSYTAVRFEHRYNTDSLKDGGYLETSYDNGQTWNNIANDPYIGFGGPFTYDSYPSAVIANGNEAFTGSSGIYWQQEMIVWCQWMGNPFNQTSYLRFVFSSDSLQSNKEGWMIDNIVVTTMICEGVNELNSAEKLLINPNPSTGSFTISQKGLLEIYDLVGEKVYQQEVSWKQEIINCKNLKRGVYFITLNDGEKMFVQKLVIE